MKSKRKRLNETGPPIHDGKQQLRKDLRRSKKVMAIKGALAGSSTAHGKTYLHDFIEKQLQSGPVKSLSLEEIEKLESQYSRTENP